MSFASMLRGLVAERVDFVVVGGVAASVQGSALVTNDLDVCYGTTPQNVQRLARLLATWKAYLRGVEPGLPFIMDVRAINTTPLMTLTTTEGALDILDRVSGVGTYDDARRESEEFEAFGVRFRVLALRALIAAKRATGRPKDLAQMPELEALLALKAGAA